MSKEYPEKTFIITEHLFDEIINLLDKYRYIPDGDGDERNNHEVIELLDKLEEAKKTAGKG